MGLYSVMHTGVHCSFHYLSIYRHLQANLPTVKMVLPGCFEHHNHTSNTIIIPLINIETLNLLSSMMIRNVSKRLKEARCT